MRQLKRQDRTKDMHLERKKKEISTEGSTVIASSEFTETDNKQVTNVQQTDSKAITETDNKQVANRQHAQSIEIKSDNKQVTKRITEQITIGKQTDNKQVTKSTFESLVGHEKNLLFLVFNECSRIGSLITPEITLSHICEALRINSGVAKMVIYRLTQKGILTRAKSKTGRGGWIKFGLTKELYQDLRIRETDNKEATNRNQTDNKQVTKRVTEQITSPLVSKLDNINTNLTNTDTVWNLSMIEHVEKYGINGGVIKRAREISPNLEIDQVCNVIEKFMLCMEGSASKEIKNKIAFFLSLTKKAASGEEILPEIETDTDRLMRELVTKAQETLKNRAELEEQLLEVSFQEWIGSLSGEQKLEIVPSSTLVKEGSHPHTQQFKIYYRENLWPQEKRIMLQGKA